MTSVPGSPKGPAWHQKCRVLTTGPPEKSYVWIFDSAESVVVQLPSCVQLFATPARQASLS